MTDFCFIHAADIHLDSRLKGLADYPGAPVEAMRDATRRAFDNLVRFAIEADAAFVVIAGDVYDGDWRDFNTGLYFAHGMSRLRDAGVRVALIQGNHDAQSVITKSLRLPDNVSRFATEHAESVVWEDLGVAIHGRGFGKRAESANIVASYPERRSGYVNIGVLHTSLAGSPDHEPYAPCGVEDLIAKGYDYWALGHVHARRIVRADPWIVYPGNTQGRHARETGEKGAMMVRVTDGRVAEPEFVALDAARWALVEVDAAGCGDGETAIERVEAAAAGSIDEAEGRPVALRIRVRGSCPAHRDIVADHERWTAEARQAVTNVSRSRGWVEKVAWETSAPTDAKSIGSDFDLERIADDPELVAAAMIEMRKDDEALKKKLPRDLHDLFGADNAPDAADTCALLAAKLARSGDAR
ncbi:MAG: DNA repair exonuclease [Deltaproteobacteria bacterium]|nr:DNA repair exonuclease [Deltaproteobacteria bacterium]